MESGDPFGYVTLVHDRNLLIIYHSNPAFYCRQRRIRKLLYTKGYTGCSSSASIPANILAQELALLRTFGMKLEYSFL